ncbi:helix-turn-helix transcriptional regulator [Acetobacterium sp.]|uniref:helix-turn-helix transcriptional regulator n=1 Tax=Acetobacterium sp. TaxID=1872094 RepID=UPI002F416C24
MFSNRLKYLCSTEDLTQRDHAAKLGVTSDAIDMYESGKRFHNNTILNKISDYLLGRTDGPMPVRDINRDLYDEHSYTEELEAFMKDQATTAMFQDYGE